MINSLKVITDYFYILWKYTISGLQMYLLINPKCCKLVNLKQSFTCATTPEQINITNRLFKTGIRNNNWYLGCTCLSCATGTHACYMLYFHIEISGVYFRFCLAACSVAHKKQVRPWDTHNPPNVNLINVTDTPV